MSRQSLAFAALLSVACAMSVGGCSSGPTKQPLLPLSYTGAANISERHHAVSLSLDTAIPTPAEGSTTTAGGGIVMTFSGPVAPALLFDEDDQRQFFRYLTTELARLGVQQRAEEAASDVHVQFLSLDYEFNFHRYDIEARLTMRSDCAAESIRVLTASTYDGEPMRKRWSTNAWQGKRMAAEKLLVKVIDEVLAYLEFGACPG